MSAKVLDLNFTLAAGDFRLAVKQTLPLEGVAAVFGPSGSGKTTLLRAIAGLVRPTSGYIRFNRSPWFENDHQVPAHQRPVGLLFQDARLFAHLNVADNLRFGAARRRPSLFNFDEVVTALDLKPLLARNVQTLSGGEAKRVALGRTLLASPKLLLLDEPLAGLDQRRKQEILPYLEKVARQFQLPTLYVSHDLDEVARLCDRMLVLSQGKVFASGATDAVLASLDTEAVAGRDDPGVVLRGRIAAHDDVLQVTEVDWAGERLTLPLLGNPTGSDIRLRIRAKDVALALSRPEQISVRNVLPATVVEIAPASAGLVDVTLALGGATLRSRITLAACRELALKRGSAVFGLIKTVSLEP